MRKRFTKSARPFARPVSPVRANRTICRKRPIKAAESYGWVVNDWEGWEAYNFAIDSGAFTEEELNAEIVRGLSSEEMARALAFIFRNYDFREWEERDNDEYDDEE